MRHHSTPDNDAIDAILRDKMAEILALIEAMAQDEPDCDLKLAALLDGEVEAVRIAIVDTIRDLLKSRAQEKERELDKYLEAQKRVEVTRQRNIFMQWLAWIMSEETLYKIRMAFLSRPGLEKQITSIGEDLAARGVLTQQQQRGKQELGELSASVARQQDQGKDQGKGR
jgi:hypothetical protein